MTHLARRIVQAADIVTVALDELLPRADGPESRLTEAMRYAALGPGKRLRPFFALETGKMFDLAERPVLRAACALECIHAYSLVHDDLPAMDDDDTRRGRPTVHRAYDEATAILAGDGLLTLAFDVIADPRTHPDGETRAALILLFSRALGLGGMVGGQMLDLAAEGRFAADGAAETLDEAQIRRMQAMKTGALLAGSVLIGARLGQADPTRMAALERYGSALGAAFQVADDILDIEASAEQMGKATAKDDARGKATLVTALGIDAAKRERDRLSEEAIAALAGFGPQAALLRAAAEFTAQRKS